MRRNASLALVGGSLSMLAACGAQVDLGDRGGLAGTGGTAAVNEPFTVVVGDPCRPDDERQPSFSGFAPGEINLESNALPGKSLVCLVHRFRGRVDCPFGQSEALAEKVAKYASLIPSTTALQEAGISPEEARQACHGSPAGDRISSPVTVAVAPQCASRRSSKAVYYSCRCAGSDPDATYCTCPSTFTCTAFPELSLGADVNSASSSLSGSYCVRSDSVDAEECDGGDPLTESYPDACDATLANCADVSSGK